MRYKNPLRQRFLAHSDGDVAMHAILTPYMVRLPMGILAALSRYGRKMEKCRQPYFLGTFISKLTDMGGQLVI